MTTAPVRFPDAPPRIAALRRDARGFPVPWFVPWIQGEPEFRAVDPATIDRAHRKHLCWICGGHLASSKAFVLGPMCGINRVAPEPPSHIACARFAVVACPFLSRPLAKRADTSDLQDHAPPPGVMIARNPGVTLLWETSSYRAERQPEGGYLFRIGAPSRVSWWREGRPATRDEVDQSVVTGVPALADMARQDGPEAMSMLVAQIDRFAKLLPEA
jgi:hypothetical protein